MKIVAWLWNFLENQSTVPDYTIQNNTPKTFLETDLDTRNKIPKQINYYYLNNIVNMFFPVAKGELSQLRQSTGNEQHNLDNVQELCFVMQIIPG